VEPAEFRCLVEPCNFGFALVNLSYFYNECFLVGMSCD